MLPPHSVVSWRRWCVLMNFYPLCQRLRLPACSGAFFCLFGGITRGITLTLFSGLAEKHNIFKRFALPQEQAGSTRH